MSSNSEEPQTKPTVNQPPQPQPTTSAVKMSDSVISSDKLKALAIETAIKAIPALNQENYTSWKERMLNLFENLNVKEIFTLNKGIISTDNELFIRTIMTSKLDVEIQSNVMNKDNRGDALKIWNAIIEYFASKHSANRARVWNQFSYMAFDETDIKTFTTKIKKLLNEMHEVGIQIDSDIVGYEILKKLPQSTEMDSMKTTITQNGLTKPEEILDHMRIHAHNLAIKRSSKTSSSQVSLYTGPSKNGCTEDYHNPSATHPKERCWSLYPKLRPPPKSDDAKPQAKNTRSENSKKES